MTHKIMNIPMYDSNPNNVGALVTAQVERIEADGGKIIDVDYIEGMLATLVELGLMDNVKFLADANFGVKKDGANAVSKLYDFSGNNDATQATGANQPVWTANVQGGKYGMVFDGTDFLGVTFASAFAQPNTVIIIVKQSGEIASTSRIAVDGDKETQRHTFLQAQTTGFWRIAAGLNVTSANTTQSTALFSGRFNGASSELFINGTSVITGNVGTDTLGGIYIGKSKSYAGYQLIGNAHAVIAFDTTITSKRQAVESFLNAYYSIY